MVVFISIVSFSLPAGIALYWIVSNGFTIVQNLIVKKDQKVGLVNSKGQAIIKVIYSDVKTVCKDLVKTKKVYTPSGEDYTECYNNFIRAEEKIL